ncbi:MAG: Ig-like domain-containing protein [Candidatus Levybacteria bacterium]|nr:Ig-like domain-containing protein [Candidatus Levybacteria bacterium]
MQLFKNLYKSYLILSLKASLSIVLVLSFIALSPVFFSKVPVFKTLHLNTQVMAASGVDLDVVYIERNPRYYRYCVEYVGAASRLCPGTENNKRWPDIGENVTYTAHIINKGDSLSPDFTYQWLVDGQVATSSAATGIGGGQEATVQFQTTWSSSNQVIQFKADPDNTITEIFKVNNNLSINSHDLTISIWVEKGQYDIFNNTLNLVGTYSFEDWIQAQFAKMNERFSQAQYPVSPNGILDRVRIDKIVVADELDGSQSPMNSDPDLYLIDGRWHFTDGDPTNTNGQNGQWQQYVNNYVNIIDWGLIHELGHQLGIIDLYRLGFKNDPVNNDGIQVTDLNGQVISYTILPSVFTNGGIYAGGDTSPYNDGTYFESHTAGGLSSNFNLRRGYYGEYLYDTPTNNYLKILDGLGSPINEAQAALYQKNPNTEDIDNTPEITGVTDSQGVITLTNRAVTTTFTTATNHTLKNNPFGDINVVGTNGTMLIKITKNNKEDYRWLTITDLNLAFWQGNTNSATYTIKTNLDLRNFNPNNQALNKLASSNRNSAPGHEPSKAVDGDKTTIGNNWQLDYNPINPGDWWQVDLGTNKDLGKVIVYPNAQNYSDWCDSFYIDLSTTGLFTGEQVRVVTETNTPHSQSILYSFPTTSGRYIRMTCDNLQNWTQLQEFEIFAVNTADIIAPTVTITNPSNNSYVSRNTNITIRANATDNVGVSKVEFRVNNVLKCTDTTASYSCVWKVPSAKRIKYILEAKAYDAAGNTSINTVNVTSR